MWSVAQIPQEGFPHNIIPGGLMEKWTAKAAVEHSEDCLVTKENIQIFAWNALN